MNVFRIAGDISHLASIFILINQITITKSVQGISFKTQLLYSIVFITRYLDVTFRWISLYIFAMKLFFIASSLYIIFLMRNRFRTSEVTKLDTFPIVYLLAGSGVLALIFTYDYSITEVLWAFSLFLESVAILPQLFMLQRTGQAKTLTTHYIFALGLYRALYIPNWFYRYFAEGRFDTLAVFTGIVQTLIYSDFFWVYYNRVMKGLNFELPV